MLTAMEKGIEAAQVSTPPVGEYNGIDLKILPKFICFKAALLKEKSTLQYILAIHIAAFVTVFGISRCEIHGLEKKLREKEYILAPGVMDFTTASPQTVSDSYVIKAAMNFLLQLGNINSVNVAEQYQRLSESMSLDLRIQFLEEAKSFMELVKTENISEVLKVIDHEVISTEDGNYKVTALAKRERFSSGESLGYEDEVIQMTLRLIPPEKGKEWFLEITSLKRGRAESFKSPEDKFKKKVKR